MNYLFHSNRLYSAVNLSDFQHTTAEKGWLYDNHRHPYYEFLHCLSGKILQNVGTNHYLLEAGDTLIIQGGFFHDTKIIESGEFLDFHFDIENPEINKAIHGARNIFITKESHPEIPHFVSEIMRSLYVNKHIDFNTESPLTSNSFDSAIFELQIHAYVILLLSEIAKFNQQNSSSNQHETHSESLVAAEIADIINNSFSADFKIGDIAKKMHLHRTYITSIFTKVYGMSPKDYHLNVKLERAKELLLETSDSMEEIAETLNFSSASHFSRFFKSQTTVAPSHYRNRKFK